MKKANDGVQIHRPVVWVTGASRGIGYEIAKQFASIGCKVCVSARSRRALISLAKEIESLGGRAYPFPFDITERESIPGLVRSMERSVGRIEVLVNNAGITTFKSALAASMGEFQEIIETNLLGPIACTKAVLPSMVKERRGWIFNILSRAAVMTFEQSGAYTSAKAGLYGFGKVLREEMRQYNVKVVNVLPGPTNTGMWSKSARKKYALRMMKPKSVAETVLSIFQLPDDVVVDDIVLRPMSGDID